MSIFVRPELKQLKKKEEIFDTARKIWGSKALSLEKYLRVKDGLMFSTISNLKFRIESVLQFVDANSFSILNDDSLLDLIKNLYSRYECMSNSYESNKDDSTGSLCCELWYHHQNELIPLLIKLQDKYRYLLAIKEVAAYEEDSDTDLSLLESLSKEEFEKFAEEELQCKKFDVREIALYYYYNGKKIGKNDIDIAKRHNVKNPRYLYDCFCDVESDEYRYNKNFDKNLSNISPFLIDEARFLAESDAVIYEREWCKPVVFENFKTYLKTS